MKKRRELHPMAVRILSGEDVSMCEIEQSNAQRIMDWVRHGGHEAEGCMKKDCIHKPRGVDVEYAARLASHEFCCNV